MGVPAILARTRYDGVTTTDPPANNRNLVGAALVGVLVVGVVLAAIVTVGVTTIQSREPAEPRLEDFISGQQMMEDGDVDAAGE